MMLMLMVVMMVSALVHMHILQRSITLPFHLPLAPDLLPTFMRIIIIIALAVMSIVRRCTVAVAHRENNR